MSFITVLVYPNKIPSISWETNVVTWSIVFSETPFRFLSTWSPLKNKDIYIFNYEHSKKLTVFGKCNAQIMKDLYLITLNNPLKLNVC